MMSERALQSAEQCFWADALKLGLESRKAWRAVIKFLYTLQFTGRFFILGQKE